MFIQSWCKPSTDIELLKSWILYNNFQGSNIFEISEIFEVQIRSDRMLKFKARICSDLEFWIFEKFESDRILNVSNFLDNVVRMTHIPYPEWCLDPQITILWHYTLFYCPCLASKHLFYSMLFSKNRERQLSKHIWS